MADVVGTKVFCVVCMQQVGIDRTGGTKLFKVLEYN